MQSIDVSWKDGRIYLPYKGPVEWTAEDYMHYAFIKVLQLLYFVFSYSPILTITGNARDCLHLSRWL